VVASVWGSKEALWSLGSELLERDGKLKFPESFLDSIQGLEIKFSLIGQSVGL
jgi:hypothetical protein